MSLSVFFKEIQGTGISQRCWYAVPEFRSCNRKSPITIRFGLDLET